MAGSVPDPVRFETAGAPVIRGESVGRGPAVVLCHGLSAARGYVVHGSKVLPRQGYRLITYDARGHGRSDPAPDGYTYEALASDLGRVIDLEVPEGPLVLGGHSMGCHTVLSWALANPYRVSALILAGPVFTGSEDEADLSRWDARADALERGGPAEFARVSLENIQGDEKTIATVERIARARTELHEHPEAVADALRQVPRSKPFESIEQLTALKMPALVVASHDEIDPGHPYAVAESYAEMLPEGELVSETKGDSPLSWQGGRLSRVIVQFLARNGIEGVAG